MRRKNFNTYCWFLAYVCLALSCASASKRKSDQYYFANKEALLDLKSAYDLLYGQQAFSAGFTDKSFRYYLMEVNTDTIRYIYDTERSEAQLISSIARFGYDTALIRKFSRQLLELKCLWISKASFYEKGRKETVTYLSFRSASSGNVFVENKYFILVFLPKAMLSEEFKKRIKKGDLVRIEEDVYFTIGNKFR